MEGSTVELDADDREHHDREQNQKTDLKERRHGLQYTLQYHLKTLQTTHVCNGSISSIYLVQTCESIESKLK